MKRAALYCRVSTERQVKEGDSIPAQITALRKYVADHNYIIAGEYIDDGVSGTRPDRDELQRLLSDIENVDIILVTKLDRLYRSIKHYLNMMDVLDRAGVGWLAIWEPMYDTTTPSGRLIVNQMMSIAQFEAENTGQRIRQVFAYKRAKGEVTSGKVPAGYRIENKHLALSENADSARIAFETYARTNSLGQTLIECSGLPGLPRMKASLRDMLRNRIYMGEFHGIPGGCPAIVSEELFDEVQRGLSMNVKTSQKRVHIFSGLIKCGCCGKSCSAQTRTRKDRPGQYVRTYYRCTYHFDVKPPQCPNSKTISESVLEKHLLSEIRPQIEGLVLSYEIEEGKRRDMDAQITAVDKRLSRLKEAYLAEVISLEEYKRDRETLERQLADMKKAPRESDFDSLKALLSVDIETLYEGMDRAEKRRFWRGIVKKIEFGEDRSIKVWW